MSSGAPAVVPVGRRKDPRPAQGARLGQHRQSFAFADCKTTRPACQERLNGKKLKAAKKKIKAADCRVGLVSKKNGVKVATGKVVKQSPKPGKVLPAKTGVSVRLG
jgi:hypothetical protein